MRISDWSSDVCSSDLEQPPQQSNRADQRPAALPWLDLYRGARMAVDLPCQIIDAAGKIGRASCRERVCQYVYISVVAVSLKKNTTHHPTHPPPPHPHPPPTTHPPPPHPTPPPP